jgi:hypothetical protein
MCVCVYIGKLSIGLSYSIYSSKFARMFGRHFLIAGEVNSRWSKPLSGLSKPLYGPIRNKFAMKFRNTTGDDYGGHFIYHLRGQLPEGQNTCPVVQNLYKSPTMDRLNPNLPLIFGITLWMFEDIQLCFITREVKPRFRSVNTCIEATFKDRFNPNLASSFGIPLGMINGGQCCYISRGVNTRVNHPFPVNHNLHGPIQNIFGIKWKYTSGV